MPDVDSSNKAFEGFQISQRERKVQWWVEDNRIVFTKLLWKHFSWRFLDTKQPTDER